MLSHSISGKFALERKLKWSESKTYSFVSELSKAECIWNSSHPNYKNKHVRDAAVMSLARAFDCSPVEIKKKIKGLRGTYIQELHKIEDSKNSLHGNYYKPRLIWFDLMDSFMNAQVKSDRLIRTTQTFLRHMVKLEDAEDPIAGISTHDSNADSTNQIQHNDPLDDNPTSDVPEEELIDWDSVDSSELLIPSHTQQQENSFDIFGKSVAQQLKEFTSVAAALRAQAKIQSLLSEERIRELTSSHSD